MTAMKNDNASERAAALVHEALDVLQRAANAPDSPVNTFLPAKLRRGFRRAAERLRRRKAQPRYRNLHTSEELADVYERTVQRDEILEQALRDFKRITLDLGRVLEENGPEVGKAIGTLLMEVKRSAEEHGPGSEAARRYRHLQFLAWFGRQYHSRKRRQRVPAPWRVPLVPDSSVEARNQETAAELLASPPSSGEAVIAIPPDGRDSGRGRIFLRIGVGEGSWIGSFERGHKSVSTIFMMPDGKHLFVSAGRRRVRHRLEDANARGGDRHGNRRCDAGRAHDGVRRRSQRHEPGSFRKDRPPVENGSHRFRRISADGDQRRRARRRSAAAIPAGVGRFFRETGDG
jgi:hypothetical protein